ncbi:hypothetical protein [Eudoraea chungangensis]|uniref:hypothetical protein n=1 Tax=Eudoraea chungangensis TaxID=1481905 RepID=UPI0023ED8F79|nr:hypothetical protein [Eudoraea chungangensis]
MKKRNRNKGFPYILLFVFIVNLSSCSTSENYFKKEYRRVWKETVQSEAWLNSLQKTPLTEAEPAEELYSSTEEVVLATMSSKDRERASLFIELYDSYVSRAYYKLIKEAQNADKRLLADYNRLLKDSKNRTDKSDYKKELANAKLRYEAHWEMLEGLKSWNAFSEYGSDDLDYFKQEQLENAYLMFRKGSSDTEIINFLVYKLADLYHFDE